MDDEKSQPVKQSKVSDGKESPCEVSKSSPNADTTGIGKLPPEENHSKESIGSNSNWSVETLAHAPSCERHAVPYSEQTKQQIELIKHLVEEQEKETAAKATDQSTDDGEPKATVSTTYAQDRDWIQAQINEAYEERRKKEERAQMEKEKRKAQRKK